MKKIKKVDKIISKIVTLIDEEDERGSSFLEAAILALEAYQHYDQTDYNEAVVASAELMKIIDVSALSIIADIVGEEGNPPTMPSEWRFKN